MTRLANRLVEESLSRILACEEIAPRVAEEPQNKTVPG